ncbi:sterol desaturase family protein [uncultured Tateyamaria sp.]|uniref:sterol desaturase family protein n=1 Tax=uncultured Tateyamaria sp. TaxID=455651 RepID=UPI002617CEE2|nr:sterol desaturase family protein [uncultured Tateyamaria sp.]
MKDKSHSNALQPETVPAGSSREWNFHPNLPIGMSPVFDLPPKPKAALAWIAGAWLKRTPPVNHLIFAVAAYLLFWPSLDAIRSAPWASAAQMLAVNSGSVLVLAGALHIYLYVLAGQEMRLKFDVRPMEKSKRFTFGNQVWDNMFWSLASGVPIWTAWVVLYFVAAAHGLVPMLETIGASPIWFVLFFFVIRFWQSFHFYWIHRLIHIPWMFRNVHHLHHRNINVGPWSGLAMHPVEHVLYYSGILIHFVLPSHPIHVLFHLFALNLGAVFSHAGFDKILVKDAEAIKAGSFHHQLHHRYFECNYGSEEIPLDRWFGSFHDGTQAATQRIRARKKALFSAKQPRA